MKQPDSPLMQAVKDGDLDRAQDLLEGGASANEIDPETKGTALHIAVMCGHASMVKLLLDHNADVNATNKFNITPVMYAARNSAEILRYLLKRNPDLEKEDFMGRDALTWATNQVNQETTALIQTALGVSAEQIKSQAQAAKDHQTELDNQAELRKHRVKTVLKAAP